MPIKILNIVPDRGYGGIQQVALTIEIGLINHGNTVSTISLDDFFNSRQEIWLFRWIRVMYRYHRFLKYNKYDILIIHHPIATLLLPFALRKKTIYVLHGPFVFPGACMIKRFNQSLLNCISFIKSNVVVVVSSNIALDFPKFFSLKIRTIHNAPANNFFQISKHSKFDYLSKYCGIKLVQYGRLCHQKNQKYSIKILKKLLDRNIKAQLVIIGDGVDYQNLLEFSKKNNLLTCKQDEMPSDKYDIIFSSSISGLSWMGDFFDVAIFPSRYEGYPISIVECLSIGLPVLTSDCKYGPAEIFKKYFINNNEIVDHKDRMIVMQADVESNLFISHWVNAVMGIKRIKPQAVPPSLQPLAMRNEMVTNWKNLLEEFKLN
jgi:glycosyltransferase involved in cell wall biosynthesis